jgi:formylmethanofuran dehydrogenase subunit E
MRTTLVVAMLLFAGCATGQRPPAEVGGHGHGLQGTVEVKTPPLVRMVEFHGHLGPYVVLGHRAGEAARQILGSPGYFDLDAEVTSPLHTPQSCFIDGVQLGAGCSVGKRNLTVTEGEKVGASFRSKNGKAVRIELRGDLPGKIAAWIEKEGVEATAHKVMEMSREEVFVVLSQP